VDLLAVAKAVSSEVFPNFSYGSDEAQCQVNCVYFQRSGAGTCARTFFIP
jgi:hypothetical protein